MKKIIFMVVVVCFARAVFAGVPVVDLKGLAEAKARHLKEYAEMINQLNEAKKQVNALTGFKGFGSVVDEKQMKKELQKMYNNILDDNYSALSKKASEYLTGEDPCANITDSKNKLFCERQRKGGITGLEYVEKINDAISKKMDYLTNLSKKIKQTKDMKSIAELQASIQIEGNSISLLQQQANNFHRLAQAKQSTWSQREAEQEYLAEKQAITDNDKKIKEAAEKIKSGQNSDGDLGSVLDN